LHRWASVVTFVLWRLTQGDDVEGGDGTRNPLERDLAYWLDVDVVLDLGVQTL
jgi:hypothetical protein